MCLDYWQSNWSDMVMDRSKGHLEGTGHAINQPQMSDRHRDTEKE